MRDTYSTPQNHSGPDPQKDAATSGTTPVSQGTAEQAKDAAQDVAGDAGEAAGQVKDTAINEAADVKDDAVEEAKGLGDEAFTKLKSQASDQMDRAAGTVRTFSDDLDRMAHGQKPNPGAAADLVEQVNSRADTAATWMEQHEPADVLDQVQRFARKRPVAFVAIAAGIGFAAGRLTRGMAQNGGANQDLAGNAGQLRSGSTPATGNTTNTAAAPISGSAPSAGPGDAAPAPVSGAHNIGAPAHSTGRNAMTPGHSVGTDPYAGGGSR